MGQPQPFVVPSRPDAAARPRRVAGGALDTLAARVRPVALARQQQLPVLPALAPLLPDGCLRRGVTVSLAPPAPGPAGRPSPGAEGGVGSSSGVGDEAPALGVSGVTSLALALATGPSQGGSWVAVVGLASTGLVAAAEMGLALDRLVLVDEPERGRWAAVVAALVDGFDVVMVNAGPRVRRRPADVRRLAARVRERGSVLVAVGGELPERSQVHLSVAASAWEGVEPSGPGRLVARRAVVVAGGRGEASRPRRAELWLPSSTGEVAPAVPLAPTVPLPMPALATSRPVPEPAARGALEPADRGALEPAAGRGPEAAARPAGPERLAAAVPSPAGRQGPARPVGDTTPVALRAGEAGRRRHRRPPAEPDARPGDPPGWGDVGDVVGTAG